VTPTGTFTVKLNGSDPLPNALVAVTLKAATPTAVGVPLMTPVEVFNANPAGKAPLVTPQVRGALPEAVRVWE
jgi:hypothetical protein